MAQAKSQDEWNEAADESAWQDAEGEKQIVMENVGDVFTARYFGMDPPLPSGIVQGHFGYVNEEAGDYFMNLPTDLKNKLRKVPSKALVRIQWTENLDTGQATPMRVFKVQWKP